MATNEVIAEVSNPEGHLVQLRRDTWDHVLDEHVEMQDYLEDVMAAIMGPDDREPDERPGRERYFRRGGPPALDPRSHAVRRRRRSCRHGVPAVQ
jgi:hypothetical protein